MADRIGGITIPISYDTSEVTKAIKEMNKETSASFSELSKIEKALKFNPDSTELLAQKMEVLGNVIEDSKKKLELLKKAQEEAAKSTDTKKGQEEYRKLTREIIETESKINRFTDQLNKVDDTKAPDNLKKDIGKIGEEVKETNGAIGEWGDSFKNLLGAGAIGGVLAGVSQIAGAVSGLLNDALEESRNKSIIKFSMNIDEKSVAAVQQSIRTVEAYGLDGQEALQGVRKQFLLNKDASDEANESIVKMAGYLATAYSGLDFNEIIQETNEIATQFEIGQEEALAMVDALLKVGFPEDQLDIISEYGNQLKMAGYEAEDIQAIFKAGIETGSWNIDNLLDGVKEGRIKLTEFAREVPETMDPVLESIGMTAFGFQGLAKQIAEGGPKGKKAYELIAKAVLDVEDKTDQAAAGTAIWGTLWEEQGTKVAETIVNASGEIVTATDNMDNLNKAIAGMDADPAKRYAEAMQDLNVKLTPVKTVLAEIVSGGLDVLNAAMEGTSVKGKELDQVITDLVASGTKNAQQYGYVWAEYEDGRVMVSDATGTHFRNLSKEEQALWAENAAALKTNAQSINDLITEKMESYKETTELGMTGAEVATVKAMSAMETAVRSYATNSGTELEKARGSVTKLAEKYGFSEEQVVTVLENWGGSVEDFDKAHGEALGRAEKAVTDYTTVATDGFNKLTQNETISWKEYLKNMEANRKAQADWWKNLKILNAAGVDDAIIAELQAMGPAGAAQLQRFVDELYKGSDKQGTAYDDMDKKTKGKVDKINETRRKGFEDGSRIADEAINEADWPDKGERMIEETAEGIANTIPELKEASGKAGASASTSTAKGITDNKPKVTEAAKALVRAADKELGIMSGDGEDGGENFNKGVAKGIKDNEYLAERAARKLARDTRDAFDQQLEINSPSRVMEKSGGWIPAGVAAGIESKSGMVEKAMTDLARIPQEVDWLTNPTIAGDFQRASQPAQMVNNYPVINVNNPVMDTPERVRKLAEEMYRLQNQRR